MVFSTFQFLPLQASGQNIMKEKEKIVKQMNLLGKNGEAFVFIIDFECKQVHLFDPKETDRILWKANENSNTKNSHGANGSLITDIKISPVSFENYKKGFDLVQHHIQKGDTYLVNFTQPTPIRTDLSLEDIYNGSSARYKILLKDKFVCFSPETFVQIKEGKISSFPMKGTIDASIPNADQLILNDSKEMAEHSTIVDLIRNDLSMVSENVSVEKFRYLEKIQTNRQSLLQMSSVITGVLPENYIEKIGDIIFQMLPAGSICGAPKNKTVEIIKEAEKYERGFYTGIFGWFDGKNLDSCVLIRFIENQNGEFVYKSGGGITFMSKARNEYEELINKVYIPV